MVPQRLRPLPFVVLAFVGIALAACDASDRDTATDAALHAVRYEVTSSEADYAWVEVDGADEEEVALPFRHETTGSGIAIRAMARSTLEISVYVDGKLYHRQHGGGGITVPIVDEEVDVEGLIEELCESVAGSPLTVVIDSSTVTRGRVGFPDVRFLGSRGLRDGQVSPCGSSGQG